MESIMLLCVLSLTTASEDIMRPNIGVTYTKVGKLVNGDHPWMHSFVFVLPDMNDMLPEVNYDRLPNMYAALLQTVHVDILQQAEELKEYARMSINALPKEELKTICKRGKRSAPLAFIGGLKSLFGTATYDDVAKVARKVNKIIANERKLDKGVLHLTENLESYMKVNDDRTDKIKALFEATYGEVKAVENTLHAMRSMEKIKKEFLINLTTAMDSQMYIAGKLRERLIEIRSAIDALSVGRLPKSLITVRDIQSVLDDADEQLRVRKHFGERFQFTVSDPHFYLMQSNFLVHLVRNREIWVTIKMPVGEDSEYNLFRLQTWGVPVSSKSKFDTYIQDLPLYFAMNFNRNRYRTLSLSEMTECTGTTIRTCPFKLVSMAMAVDTKTCLSNIVMNNNVGIHAYCEFKLKMFDESMPRIKAISEDKFVVKRTGGYKIMLNCGGHFDRFLPPCTSCLVELPCSCKIVVGGNIHSTSKVRKCSGSSEAIATSRHLINMAVLMSFLQAEELASLSVSTDKVYEKEISMSQKQMDELETKFERNWQLERLDRMRLSIIRNDIEDLRTKLAKLPDDMIDMQWLETASNNTYILYTVAFVLAVAIVSVIWYLYRKHKRETKREVRAMLLREDEIKEQLVWSEKCESTARKITIHSNELDMIKKEIGSLTESIFHLRNRFGPHHFNMTISESVESVNVE